MAHRQFVTWTTEQTPFGTGSWAMIDNLLHVRSAVGTKVAALGSLTPQEPGEAADVGIVEGDGMLRLI
jgi:hypothetical protein